MKRALLFLLLVWCLQSSAQTDQQLIMDYRQDEVFGARNLIFAQGAITYWQDRVIPDTLFRERNFWLKTAGFGYRMLRYALFDAQIDYLTALSQHEVFGHGARYREMGHQENSFHLNLFFPYGDGSGFARSGTLGPGYKISRQEALAKIFAGNEANQVLSATLSREMLLNDNMHYRQASLFLISHNNLAAYIWQTRLTSNNRIGTNGDIASYIFEINSLAGSITRPYTKENLSWQCLMGALNPLQVYALYSLVYKYGVKGEKGMTHLPMIKMGKLRYLPSLEYSLSPFGSRYHFRQYFSFFGRLLDADIHLGDDRYYTHFGLGLTCLHLIAHPIVTLNLSAAYWNQPKIETEDYQIHDFKQQNGGLLKAELLIRPLKLKNFAGLVVHFGYKTNGYVSGEILDAGFILKGGLSARF